MRRFLIVIAAVASATVLSSPAWAAGTHGHKSASCRASGTAASCSVGATVHHPGVIRAHATARRNQDVTVTWSMTCTKDKGKVSGSTSGSFTAKTPASRKLSQPFRHATSCTVSATATLAKSGHLHAWLTSRG